MSDAPDACVDVRDNELGEATHPVPWRHPATKIYSHPAIVGLHEEIEDYYNWVTPNEAEDYVRDYVLRDLIRIAKDKWPKVLVETMGSYSTGLNLPASDIDVIMFGGWLTAPLNTLAELLKAEGFCDPSKTVVVDTAKVPILKIVHKVTRVKIDVAFNRIDGLKTSELIARFVEKYPLFPKIYMVVKQMLVRRGLNETFLGGLSSFGLALLVIFFFQQLEVENSGPRINLGVLLLEFFEYYVEEFDYTMYGIDVIKKKLVPKKGHHGGKGGLYIVHPTSPGDEVARSTMFFRCIVEAFSWAHSALRAEVEAKMVEPDSVDGQLCFQGALGKLVKFDDEVLKWRAEVQGMYDQRRFGPVSAGEDLMEF